MSWSERGDARAKRYEAYKRLEQHYNAALEALTAAKEEIDRKNALIGQLASELASLRPAAETPAGPSSTIVPAPLKSQPYQPIAKPGLAKAGTTRPNQTIAERLEELQQAIHGGIKEKG